MQAERTPLITSANIDVAVPPSKPDGFARQAVMTLKKTLRERHRRLVFGRAVRSLRRSLRAGGAVDTELDALIYGWNNDGWSASRELMQEVLRCACRTQGAILECGSGLTTLLLGLVAERTRSSVCSLEHDAFWTERVQRTMASYGVTAVDVRLGALRSFGDYSWYSVAPDTLPCDIALVVCDGPPADTPGGRYGLLPMLRPRLAPGCTILLDDAMRPGEQRVLERWERELGTRRIVEGSEKPFARITVR